MGGWSVEPEVKEEDAGWALLAPTQPHCSGGGGGGATIKHW